MKIKWKFDDEGELDPYALLGAIRIEDGFGNILQEECTYIDSWFIALGKGLGTLENEGRVEVDLIEEPDPLIFVAKNEKIEVWYKDHKIILQSISDAKRCLKADVTELINEVKAFPGSKDNLGIAELNKILRA